MYVLLLILKDLKILCKLGTHNKASTSPRMLSPRNLSIVTDKDMFITFI